MRYYPNLDSDSDRQELAQLKAMPWQIETLRLNPDYNGWGCFEDYMSDEKTGWAARTIFKTWDDFGPWGLNDLNEVVNFYFEIGASASYQFFGILRPAILYRAMARTKASSRLARCPNVGRGLNSRHNLRGNSPMGGFFNI